MRRTTLGRGAVGVALAVSLAACSGGSSPTPTPLSNDIGGPVGTLSAGQATLAGMRAGIQTATAAPAVTASARATATAEAKIVTLWSGSASGPYGQSANLGSKSLPSAGTIVSFSANLSFSGNTTWAILALTTSYSGSRQVYCSRGSSGAITCPPDTTPLPSYPASVDNWTVKFVPS